MVKWNLMRLGREKSAWIVVLKWRNKRAGGKELEKLLRELPGNACYRLVYLNGRFTSDDLQVASENKLLLSDGVRLSALRKALEQKNST